ncbi:MAG TPA: HAD family hydrolase [Stellaceae bacterium]|nr:HAD family hydrolase [Stellaceae bacterium]
MRHRDPRPGLILDRDGVVNEDCGYLWRVSECRFVDGIFAMVKAFASRGFAVVIATNQAGIARGYYGEDDFHVLMNWMREEFRRRDVAIDAVYHCPYHPTEGIGDYRRASPRRKPAPGMLLQAAHDLGLDLARSWCVGDKATDIEAGRAAGVGTLVLFDPAECDTLRHGDHWIVPDLAAVTRLLERSSREVCP